MTRVLHIPSPTKNTTRGDASFFVVLLLRLVVVEDSPRAVRGRVDGGDGRYRRIPRADKAQDIQGDAPAPAVHAAAKAQAESRQIPGMNDACHKVLFSKLMNRAKALFPAEFAFWPDTLILPDDWLAVADAFGQLGDDQRDPPLRAAG